MDLEEDRTLAIHSLAHDIFLSYRHIDNLPLRGEREGWISRLHSDLETRVAQYLGSTVEMWRDCRLQGNEYFTEAIEEKLRQVAVMVSVLSPGYQSSDWCLKELREFLKAAQESGGIRIGNHSRLFKVIKTPMKLEEQPEELRDLLGYAFHARWTGVSL